MPRKPVIVEKPTRAVNVDTGKYAPLFKHHRIVELELGVCYLARRGKEFTCLPASFGNYVRAAAAQMGLSAAVSVVGDEVFYTYYPADAQWQPRMKTYGPVRKARHLR